ncbi:hypothetical protein UCMB321_4599 [Pseudomonas batumici]|uniref:Uncharacterized protein n=1 Tax=Pseudomonas batumici TaxID=226910 RepID=A0A0C2E712_9PSED|nr:hypothetical protein UCMB321_4599 [Pseudomonas batumici]
MLEWLDKVIRGVVFFFMKPLGMDTRLSAALRYRMRYKLYEVFT